MAKAGSVADLFREEPYRWGLRADPHLWRDMRYRFENVALPPTVDELAALVETAFERLTGRPMSEADPFFVEKYNHGGMSGGFVDPRFWRDRALPMLQARYAEA